MTDIIADPAVYELLKEFAGGNVFADQAPDGQEAPFIVYNEVDFSTIKVLRGTSSGPVNAYFRIDAYERDPYAAKILGKKIRDKLDAFIGVVEHGENSPKDTVDIKGISFQNGASLTDQFEKPLLYRRTGVYLVKYQES